MTTCEQDFERKILRCWRTNATPWINAIKEQQITSRVTVTNQAIVDVIKAQRTAGKRVVDIGCGEGWLSRELHQLGYQVTGIDAEPALITSASTQHSLDFRVMEYSQLTSTSFEAPFDIAVANFSLLGKTSVDTLFTMLPTMLANKGMFIVQTLHPCQVKANVDGWQQGSWQGFDNSFSDPAPWYFRTHDSWQTLFDKHGFSLIETKQPINPLNQTPTSIIFIGQLTYDKDER